MQTPQSQTVGEFDLSVMYGLSPKCCFTFMSSKTVEVTESAKLFLSGRSPQTKSSTSAPCLLSPERWILKPKS
jgi:hypothetical protein